ncbi:hypothetical protein [Streptomyces collinus]
MGVDVDGDQLIVDVREVPGGATPPARVRRAFPDAAGPHDTREKDGWGRALIDAHAVVLHLSPRTVEQHVARVLRKTGALSRRDLLRTSP